jgi:aquaporin Z
LYVIIGTTSKGAAVGFAGIPIGLCLTLIHLFLIPVTNASVNPARSTGPAQFAGGAYIGQLWLFWLAPILGAALAGVVARWHARLAVNPGLMQSSFTSRHAESEFKTSEVL